MNGGILENDIDGGGIEKAACGSYGDFHVTSVIVEFSVTLGDASDKATDVAVENGGTKGLRVGR